MQLFLYCTEISARAIRFLTDYFPCIGDNASEILHVSIPHASEYSGCLTASCTGMTVDKERRFFLRSYACNRIERLERHIFAVWDMPVFVLLRCADVYQNGSVCDFVFIDCIISFN